MDKRLTALTDKDMIKLRQMMARFDHDRWNVGVRTEQEQLDTQAPDLYIAITGASGIPPMVIGANPVPGSATDCIVYRLLQIGTAPAPILVDSVIHNPTIYNVSLDTIPSGTFVIVEKDKYGTWFVVGTGGAATNCPVTNWISVSNVCNTLTVTKDHYGNVTNVVLNSVVEYVVYTQDTDGCIRKGTPFCVTNPTGCCTGTGTHTGITTTLIGVKTNAGNPPTCNSCTGSVITIPGITIPMGMLIVDVGGLGLGVAPTGTFAGHSMGLAGAGMTSDLYELFYYVPTETTGDIVVNVHSGCPAVIYATLVEGLTRTSGPGGNPNGSGSGTNPFIMGLGPFTHTPIYCHAVFWVTSAGAITGYSWQSPFVGGGMDFVECAGVALLVADVVLTTASPINQPDAKVTGITPAWDGLNMVWY